MALQGQAGIQHVVCCHHAGGDTDEAALMLEVIADWKGPDMPCSHDAMRSGCSTGRFRPAQSCFAPTAARCRRTV